MARPERDCPTYPGGRPTVLGEDWESAQLGAVVWREEGSEDEAR